MMDTSFKIGINQIFGRILPGWERIFKILRQKMSHPQSLQPNLYVIRRSDLNGDGQVLAKRIPLPQETAHFAVDRDNPNNQITLHVAHNCAWDPAEWIQPYDTLNDRCARAISGLPVGSMDINKLGKYIIDVESGTISQMQLVDDPDLTWATAIYTHSPHLNNGKVDNIFWNSWGSWTEFKTEFISELYKDYPLRCFPLDEVLSQKLPSHIIRLNTDKMTIEDSYQFPPGYFGNSPQFVPRAGSSDRDTKDGYIVTIVFASQTSEHFHEEIWIFNASKLSAGPVCKLKHPMLKFGFTLHSTWMPTIQWHKSEYTIAIEQDYSSLLDNEPIVVRQLFEKYVFPNWKLTNQS